MNNILPKETIFSIQWYFQSHDWAIIYVEIKNSCLIFSFPLQAISYIVKCYFIGESVLSFEMTYLYRSQNYS